VDPLKPFTSAILALWPQDSRRMEKGQRASETGPSTEREKAAALTPARPIQTLHGRLRSRMSTLAQWNAAQARQRFVECVLVAELGEHLASDPAFSALVQRVSQQLENDAKLSARLDALLKRVVAGEAIA
jgi:hypothetical protein